MTVSGRLALAALVVALTGCAAPTVQSAPVDALRPSRTATAPASPSPAVISPGQLTQRALPAVAGDGTALAVLATLPVKGRAPKTGYDRDLFGQAWADIDRNGCDTRNDILARDLSAETFRAGTRDCVVLTGTLADPYTGQSLTFSKQDASAVHIDHVVALSDAWQKGARQWDRGRRLSFANDPLNLLAVDGPTNASKSDGDAATWLPPNEAYRCPMVARQVAVKQSYDLWVTAAERDAIARVLTTCPDEALPTGASTATVPAESGETAPAHLPAEPPPAPAPAPASGEGPNPDNGICEEANANGARPYRQGDSPEYDWYFDADGDGIVCE